MYTVLLVIHSILVLFLIGIILLQRSDSDGLSGLGGGGGGNLLSGRAAGNIMTRVTAVLAVLFIVSSLTLTVIGAQKGGTSLLDRVAEEPVAEAPAVTEEAPKAKAKPSEPTVPKPE